MRCPAGCDRDGKLYFTAKLNEGEAVRLSYANPRRLPEDTKRYAEAMQEFEPEALRIFAASVSVRAGEIERARAARDLADYAIRVHALKSMARSIGAEELSGLAARLEAAGDAGDADTV